VLSRLDSNRPALYARFGMTAFLNCLFGCIFYNAGRLGDTPDDARTHFGAVAQILIGAMFGSANPVLLAFPLERPVFLREYSTATYGLLPYFLSKTAVELVLGFLTMSVRVACVYVSWWCAGAVVHLPLVWLGGAAPEHAHLPHTTPWHASALPAARGAPVLRGLRVACSWHFAARAPAWMLPLTWVT
jgi:hypothetical protein